MPNPDSPITRSPTHTPVQGDRHADYGDWDIASTAPELDVLAAALDALSAHIAVIDRDGVIVAVNGAWRRFALLNAGDRSHFNVGDNYLEVCDGSAGACSEEAFPMARGIRAVMEGVLPSYYLEYACHTPDAKGWYQVRVTPLGQDASDGEPEYFVVSHENITEAKTASEELRNSQAHLAHLVRLGTMGELAAGIAHELNQPLAAIANYASGCKIRLKDTRGIPPEILEALEDISGQANRAGEIIRRLRGFIRRSEPQTMLFGPAEAITETVELLRHQANMDGVTVVADAPIALPCIAGDSIQIQQVLLNLIKNAIDAMVGRGEQGRAPAGSEVRVSAWMSDPQHVCIEVADNGPGLPGDILEHIFEAFYTTKETGLGLGLSLSHSIVDGHRGTITAENKVDGGAVFRVTLPIAAEQGSDRNRSGEGDRP